MTRRRQHSPHPRCVICRQPVLPRQDKVVRHMPAGLLASQVHREVTNVWHRECWDEVSRDIEESRKRSEARQRQQILDVIAAMSPETRARVLAEHPEYAEEVGR